jgi:hypothetical protein
MEFVHSQFALVKKEINPKINYNIWPVSDNTEMGLYYIKVYMNIKEILKNIENDENLKTIIEDIKNIKAVYNQKAFIVADINLEEINRAITHHISTKIEIRKIKTLREDLINNTLNEKIDTDEDYI